MLGIDVGGKKVLALSEWSPNCDKGGELMDNKGGDGFRVLWSLPSQINKLIDNKGV